MTEEQERDPQYEGWLTAVEAQEAVGVSSPTLSRWAAAGDVIREKVDGKYLFEPTSLQERAQKFRPDMRSKEGLPENATANTIAASAGMIRALSAVAVDGLERVIEMSRVQESAYRTLNERAFMLVEKLSERCDKLEATHSELIATREAYLDGQVERELRVAQAQASDSRKDMMISKLAENADAIFALLRLIGSGSGPESSEQDPEGGDDK